MTLHRVQRRCTKGSRIQSRTKTCLHLHYMLALFCQALSTTKRISFDFFLIWHLGTPVIGAFMSQNSGHPVPLTQSFGGEGKASEGSYVNKMRNVWLLLATTHFFISVKWSWEVFGIFHSISIHIFTFFAPRLTSGTYPIGSFLSHSLRRQKFHINCFPPLRMRVRDIVQTASSFLKHRVN